MKVNRGNFVKITTVFAFFFQKVMFPFHGLSPLRKLNQGYSYVSDKEGKTLTSVSQVKQGDGLLIYVTDGTIEASVQNTKASSYGADTDSEK